MQLLNSRVIMSRGIRMDREYKNVLSYHINEMLQLLTTEVDEFGELLVNQASNFSYIRDRNAIRVNFPIEQCLISNYIAFQNPDYSNKWFFCWIDECKYINDNCTELIYTVDIYSTWYEHWKYRACFVERETVGNDTIGSNTIPEDVNLGPAYVVNNYQINDFSDNLLVGYAYTKRVGRSQQAETPATFNGITTGIIYSGGNSIANSEDVADRTRDYIENGEENAIVKIFAYPGVFGAIDTNKSATTIEGRNLSADGWFKNLDGYTPKNNKLLTYPYTMLNVVSSDGNQLQLQHELFDHSQTGSPDYFIRLICLPSFTAEFVPYDYNGYERNYDNRLFANVEVPITWVGDAYKQWQATQGQALVASSISSTLQTLAGLAIAAGASVAAAPATFGASIPAGTAAVAALTGGAVSATSTAVKLTAAQDAARHSTNTVHGDMGTTGLGFNVNDHTMGFILEERTIQAQYARIIDDYFSRFGYQVNRIKFPEHNRKTWDYIKISSESCIGYGATPSIYMDVINNIYRRGVTIWHKHKELGNFDLPNPIQPETT